MCHGQGFRDTYRSCQRVFLADPPAQLQFLWNRRMKGNAAVQRLGPCTGFLMNLTGPPRTRYWLCIQRLERTRKVNYL